MRKALKFDTVSTKRKALNFKAERDVFLESLRGKYIYCVVRTKKGNKERWVSAVACYKHSQGITNLKEAKPIFDENCYGCTMWLDYLNRQKKKQKERQEKRKSRKKFSFKPKRKKRKRVKL